MSTDVEDILKATIQTKVIEAFNQTPEMIDKLVTAAISKDVDKFGGNPGKFDNNTMPYMDWLVGEEIRKAITESVREYVAENKGVLKSKVHEAISSTDFGKPLADALAKILSDEWRWSVNLDINEDR